MNEAKGWGERREEKEREKTGGEGGETGQRKGRAATGWRGDDKANG